MRPPVEDNSFSLKSLLPSSLVSLTVHVAILMIAGMSLRGCDTGAPTAAGGQEFREIGLAVVNDNSDANTNVPAQNPQETEDVRPSVPDAKPQQAAVPTEVPNVAELMNQSRSLTESTSTIDSEVDLSNTIGPGRAISGVPEMGGGLAELIRPPGKSGMGSAGSLTPGPGETSFMDIVGKGRSFVYVIDTSSSMMHNRRLELAKNQLKGSLRLLKPNQKFQVLFYNESVTEINLRRRKHEAMYPATSIHVQLAVQAIEMQTANSGTKHLPAIERALLLQPDVIYFLTDGDTPSLNADELRLVRRQNRSDAEIHVIEFAAGARESRRVSWLQFLASDSGGQYRRIAVN